MLDQSRVLNVSSTKSTQSIAAIFSPNLRFAPNLFHLVMFRHLSWYSGGTCFVRNLPCFTLITSPNITCQVACNLPCFILITSPNIACQVACFVPPESRNKSKTSITSTQNMSKAWQGEKIKRQRTNQLRKITWVLSVVATFKNLGQFNIFLQIATHIDQSNYRAKQKQGASMHTILWLYFIYTLPGPWMICIFSEPFAPHPSVTMHGHILIPTQDDLTILWAECFKSWYSEEFSHFDFFSVITILDHYHKPIFYCHSFLLALLLPTFCILSMSMGIFSSNCALVFLG